MSSISSVSAASSQTQVVQRASAQQEATESAAVTRKEAAAGDQVAVRKLAQQQAQQPSQSAAKIDSDGDHDGTAKRVEAAAQKAETQSIRTPTGAVDTQA